MKFSENNPPRKFEAGFEVKRYVHDCGRLELAPDEQVTFLTESKKEYDVARKSWGFYATPSLNGRLQNFHLRAVLVKNRISRYFVLLVEEGKEEDFQQYIDEEKIEIISWLDSKEALEALEKKLKG